MKKLGKTYNFQAGPSAAQLLLLLMMAWFPLMLLAGSPNDPKPVKFAVKRIRVGNEKLSVEIADTPEKLAHGLMYRRSLQDNEGMLFIFKDQDVRQFWMKNTFVDLAIAFVDQEKKITDIQEMKAVTSEMETNPPLYTSASPAKFALEVPSGWFSKHKIKVGEKLVLSGVD